MQLTDSKPVKQEVNGTVILPPSIPWPNIWLNGWSETTRVEHEHGVG
jgi:hypothetical protein